jgi:hypothetical protein
MAVCVVMGRAEEKTRYVVCVRHIGREIYKYKEDLEKISPNRITSF